MFRLQALSVSFSIALALTACGSDDGSQDEGGLKGSGAATGTGANTGAPIDVGSGGSGTGTGSGNQDGGTVPLTDSQIEEIENSACAGWTTEGELLPAVLQLVVDVSGSMERDAPGDDTSKWEITQEALRAAIADMPASTSVGVLYYPNLYRSDDTGESWGPRDINECVRTNAMVSIAPLGAEGSDHRAAIGTSLDDANTGGGTPTHDAYRYALREGLEPYASSASKFMLLITDGQPTYELECIGDGSTHYANDVDEQPIIDEISAAAVDGIRTFVIGSPGSEEGLVTDDYEEVIDTFDARPWLSRAAIVGGTSAEDCEEEGPTFCHMDMTEAPSFSEALTAGLKQIAGQINVCTYAIPEPPDGEQIDLNQVNLILTDGQGDAELVLPDNTGECGEGWTINSKEQVVLCQETCERVQKDSQARVELLFGCASGEVPIPK